MVSAFQTPITADEIKDKARALGADLVGIADGAVMNANPPDADDPRRPSDISDHDAGRVIVLAQRVSLGAARILDWSDRHKYYNDELTITALEEIALDMVRWLERKGYPALIVPGTHIDPWRYKGDPHTHQRPPLSLEHAGVEAGLGTLGLNLQLLTPEYGPRVILTSVLCSAPVEADERMATSLCHGPDCGRCLAACPGDAVGHWNRDWVACDTYRHPNGFKKLNQFLNNVIDESDPETQKLMLRNEDSFDLWTSILRGAGAITGCRRCQDVCPVGDDYEEMLKDALDEIPEDGAGKQKRLTAMQRAENRGKTGADHERQKRWIGTNGK
jgi:epoxyqueuosine reductase